MSKKVDSIKHKEKRAHIPSKEEAGYEDANNTVNQGKTNLELPKNPVIHRGQDPELFWMNKYGNDDREDVLKVDIRSLYRHEHIAPEQLIQGLYKTVVDKKDDAQTDMFSSNEMFGNALDRDELEKVSEYYQHSDGWTNRLIQGDSHLVMASLLEREGMAGQVQSIYIDPPYGINYSSNWQMKLNNRTVKENDENLSGEPEMIKAFRDTWELGIHSYLSYLRDRLLIAKELLTDTGSCFIQISDENLHLVRNICDEIFGSENFVSVITFRKKTMQFGSKLIEGMSDYIIWYSRDKENCKYRQLFTYQSVEGVPNWTNVELSSGEVRKLSKEEWNNHKILPEGSKVFRPVLMRPSGYSEKMDFEVEFQGKIYTPAKGGCWSTTESGMKNLIKENRVFAAGTNLYYKLFHSDYPVSSMTNLWSDMSGPKDISYIVQTFDKVIQRCILMSSDPGDLVLDPTCGSGTTAFVAEKWGRRWITIDTSRIAINLAKNRIATAIYPYYNLYDSNGDVRQGFKYETVPHITLKSIANNEPSKEETLYDEPVKESKKLRVSGPFTVETLQNYEPISPDAIDNGVEKDNGNFEERIFEHLKSAGVKNGIKNEQAVFIRIEQLADSFLHAEGFYIDSNGVEKKAYFHIGPKFGTVAKKAVNEAVKSCRQRGDADWLIVLGFSFESDINNQNITMSVGSFEVTKARMHDDLMQDGLLKKDKKAASFVTIGEPDIQLHKNGSEAHVEVCGLDIYDPIKDVVKARNIEDIAYWMVDDDYDGSNFVVKQVFFCGGKKDEFKKWRKGLDDLAKRSTKKKVEMTLKIEIDDEAFDRLYGFESHPFEATKGHKVAVRVISQFGEESTKVLTV